MSGGALSVEVAREKYKDLSSYFAKDAVMSRISKEITNKYLTAEKMTQLVLSAAVKNKMLLEATPESLCQELQKACAMGLAPNGIDGHLVPFRDRKRNCVNVVFIADYKGLIKLMYRSGLVIGVYANAVRKKDVFEYRYGHGSRLTHHPFDAETHEGRGPLCNAWAMVELKGGGSPFVVLSRADVDARRKASRGSDSQFSPWTTSPDAMWAKSAIRQLAKFVPLTPEIQEEFDKEAKNEYAEDVIDVESLAAGDVQNLEHDDEGEPEPTPPPQTRTQRLAQAANVKTPPKTTTKTAPPKAQTPPPQPPDDEEEESLPKDEPLDVESQEVEEAEVEEPEQEPEPEATPPPKKSPPKSAPPKPSPAKEDPPSSRSTAPPEDADPRTRKEILDDFQRFLFSPGCSTADDVDLVYEENITLNRHKLRDADAKWAMGVADGRKKELADAATTTKGK